MPVNTAAGTTIAIGSTVATAPDPVIDTYVDIGEVVNIPPFGRTYALITHNPIADRKTFKFKGSYNDGSFELQLGRDLEDLGQDAALIALDSDDTFNLRVQLNDDPADGSGSAPSAYYIPGKIMSFPTVIESVDSIVAATMQIEVDGDITLVEAVPGV